MSNPTPAEVIRKAREHNITTREAMRVLLAMRRIEEIKAMKAGTK